MGSSKGFFSIVYAIMQSDRNICANIIWEVICMATKSILKNVNITDKRLARTFVNALEETEGSKYESVQLTRKCKEITGEKIKEFFGK